MVDLGGPEQSARLAGCQPLWAPAHSRGCDIVRRPHVTSQATSTPCSFGDLVPPGAGTPRGAPTSCEWGRLTEEPMSKYPGALCLLLVGCATGGVGANRESTSHAATP